MDKCPSPVPSQDRRCPFYAPCGNPAGDCAHKTWGAVCLRAAAAAHPLAAIADSRKR
jgi:hypothetical protein